MSKSRVQREFPNFPQIVLAHFRKCLPEAAPSRRCLHLSNKKYDPQFVELGTFTNYSISLRCFLATIHQHRHAHMIIQITFPPRGSGSPLPSPRIPHRSAFLQDLQTLLAARPRHLQIRPAPLTHHTKGDGNTIRSASLEAQVLLHIQRHVEVASGSAIRSGSPSPSRAAASPCRRPEILDSIVFSLDVPAHEHSWQRSRIVCSRSLTRASST